jgi:transposase
MKCGFAADADLNAATNLSLPLIKLTKSALQLKLNKEGFYFTLVGQEFIVPVSHEAE